MTTHIGISGPIAAGKSTLAKGLVRILALMNKPSVVIPFATGLKYLGSLEDKPDAILTAFDYFRDLGYDEDKALRAGLKLLNAYRIYPVTNGKKPRKLYQYIGTEVGRDEVGKDVWIKDVQKRIRELDSKPHFVFSDDMRFVNEGEAVDYHIGITMETPSGKATYNARKSLYPADYFHSDHQSEKERDLIRDPHFTIETDFSVDAVVDLAQAIIERAGTDMFQSYTGDTQDLKQYTITADKLNASSLANYVPSRLYYPTLMSGVMSDLDVNTSGVIKSLIHHNYGEVTTAQLERVEGMTDQEWEAYKHSMNKVHLEQFNRTLDKYPLSNDSQSPE